MKKIYKYQLETTSEQIIEMIRGAEILSVQIQKGVVCVWALVEFGEAMENRVFRIYGTGMEIRDERTSKEKFIGTYQLNNGGLVFHVFEGE